jgi:hypothetical protein
MMGKFHSIPTLGGQGSIKADTKIQSISTKRFIEQQQRHGVRVGHGLAREANEFNVLTAAHTSTQAILKGRRFRICNLHASACLSHKPSCGVTMRKRSPVKGTWDYS